MDHSNELHVVDLSLIQQDTGHARPGQWSVQPRVTSKNLPLWTGHPFELECPLSPDEEENIRWYVEDYVRLVPFAKAKAESAESIITLSARKLHSHVQRILEDFLEASPEHSLVRLLFRLNIVAVATSDSIQKCHWETLETTPGLWKEPFRLVHVIRRSPTPCLGMAIDFSQSRDETRILLVSSRPRQSEDVPYRAVSKNIWEHASARRLDHGSVNITFARPGTYRNFTKILNEHPKGHFDIVHFDTHGEVTNEDEE